MSPERRPARVPSSRRAPAFTLVELLVVIGIIALLISILLPALSKARENGNWAACMSNMKQIGNALMMYAGEHKQYLPRPASATTYGPLPDDFIFWQTGQGTDTVKGAKRDIDDSPLAKYLNATGDKLQALYRCPSDLFDDRPSTIAAVGPYRYSYTMNRSWDNVEPVPTPTPPRLTIPRPKLTQVRRSTEKVLIVEEQRPNDGRWEWNNIDPSGSNKDDLLTDRHAKQSNILFHDMHVERKFWKEMSDQHKNQMSPFEPFKN
jgi:prepilin-type N-terminal cleavage/methylation domain-containing protein